MEANNSMRTIRELSNIALDRLAVQFLAGYLVYRLLKCIYRITLHPLAKFPGPKMAAMSRLYAASWDLPEATSLVKEIPKYHERYNSRIVRIEPNALHILDMDAYNQIFKIGTVYKKEVSMYSLPTVVGCFFQKTETREAKVHRDMYNSYFSRAAVQSLEPVLRHLLSQFMHQLDGTAQAHKTVDLTLAFRCLTADTIMRYCYDRPYEAVLAPDFQDKMIVNLGKAMKQAPPSWYGGKAFYYLFDLVQRLPRSWIRDESIRAALQLVDLCHARLHELQRETKTISPNQQAPTVFRTALNPDPKKGHLILPASVLATDAIVFFVAGTDTTANTLQFGLWYLLNNPTLLTRLRSELRDAIPHSRSLDKFDRSWRDLEKLPYLTAVIKESLRLSFGVVGRLARVVPPEGAQLAGSFIPGGTVVTCSTYSYHTHAAYYSEPTRFKPERWLHDPAGSGEKFAVNGGRDPEKYFMSFSKGSRSCIGVNLAWAELYYTFAYLLRHFDMEIDGTTAADMDWHDSFSPVTFGSLKVKLKRFED